MFGLLHRNYLESWLNTVKLRVTLFLVYQHHPPPSNCDNNEVSSKYDYITRKANFDILNNFWDIVDYILADFYALLDYLYGILDVFIVTAQPNLNLTQLQVGVTL